MNVLTTATVLITLLGSALIGGVFFAFSSFIMRALARMPAAEGIAAMQSINVVVLNRSFLGTFIGTAALSLLVAALAVIDWGTRATPWYLAGALLYFAGTFLVTGFGNVPWNDRLAGVSSTEPESLATWEHYLHRWTFLNTIRTAAALAAALMFIVGLMQHANP